MFITTQLFLFLANNMEFYDSTVLKFLSLEIFIFNKYFSLFMSHDFFIFKRNFCYNVFRFVMFSVITTINRNKHLKTKLLKNEEDILFMLRHLDYVKTSSFFIFHCPTEIVTSPSKTYSCRSLSKY